MARHYAPSLLRSKGEGRGGVGFTAFDVAPASRLTLLPQEAVYGYGKIRCIANRNSIGKPAAASAAITSRMPALHACDGHSLKPSLA